MLSIKRTFFAYLDELTSITILLPYSYHSGESTCFFLIEDNRKISISIESKESIKDFLKYICKVPVNVEIGKNYVIEDEHKGKTDLQVGAVIRTKEFDELFYYSGPLGVDYSPDKCDFSLWAPTAQQVKLIIQDPQKTVDERKEIDMIRIEKGVWTTTVAEQLEGFYYTYLVLINLEWREAVDPYAVAVSANGLKGAIVDLSKTMRIKPSLPPLTHIVDSVIYETHIRDFTIHANSGVQMKGTYLGAAELHTTTDAGDITGLSYVKELGVTHIEFLPVHDFEEIDELKDVKEYNWGYNPSHYNVPEGSYSLNPHNPYARIDELKTMIQVVQQQGLRVILDVVYNHVYKKEESSFEKIVPGYFFRYDAFGMPSNGTGVGNDIASERLMVRRFIVDSVRYWLEEYKVDGLRFDLMGILDIATMNQIRKLCDQYDANFLIIGEGWNLQTALPESQKAIILNQKELPRIAQFNDRFRDKIKGSTFQLGHKGFALGGVEQNIDELLSGSIGLLRPLDGLFSEPDQTVNYVESHDNHTLWDKINISFPDLLEEKKQKKHRLATTLVLLSQGIPFLHSGQEFFRTKQGVENSYQSPDNINQLDWDRMIRYRKNVEYIKGIIAFRKANSAFRMQTAEQIRKHIKISQTSNDVIEYKLENIEKFSYWKEIIVYINANDNEVQCPAPSGKWKKLIEDERVYDHNPMEIDEKIIIYPISVTVIGKLSS
ncbi:type I pullulanase [Niallia sp. 01092]|uniref:type I pullulanase n=1 Tax=unclassified Niallia TaxID=2837522 RepID=UPI003FD6234D